MRIFDVRRLGLGHRSWQDTFQVSTKVQTNIVYTPAPFGLVPAVILQQNLVYQQLSFSFIHITIVRASDLFMTYGVLVQFAGHHLTMFRSLQLPSTTGLRNVDAFIPMTELNEGATGDTCTEVWICAGIWKLSW